MSPARRPFRAISARTVELAGTNQFQMFATVNTKKFPRGILDQVISCGIGRRPSTGRAPDPGLKHQAASVKLSNQPVQASSDKRQAPGSKLQAPSRK